MIRNKQKKERGITLIALVVTIVVLLILAGVTITFVLGEGGILNMAKEAADKTKNAIANDQADMESLAGEIKNILGEDGSGGADPSEEPEPELQTDGNYDEKGKVYKILFCKRRIKYFSYD